MVDARWSSSSEKCGIKGPEIPPNRPFTPLLKYLSAEKRTSTQAARRHENVYISFGQARITSRLNLGDTQTNLTMNASAKAVLPSVYLRPVPFELAMSTKALLSQSGLHQLLNEANQKTLFSPTKD